MTRCASPGVAVVVPTIFRFPRSLCDTTCGLLKKRMIDLKRHIIAQGEVTEAGEKEIESGYCRNLIDRFDGLTILDLEDQKDFVINVLQIFLRVDQAEVSIGTGAV
jgi:hypothetical protein